MKGIILSFRISFEPFRSFRGPLFHKPVTGFFLPLGMKNRHINKQLVVIFWLNKRKYESFLYCFSCNSPLINRFLPLNSEWVLTCAGKFLLRTFLLHTSHSTSYNIERQNCIVGILGIGILCIFVYRKLVNWWIRETTTYLVFLLFTSHSTSYNIARQNCNVGILEIGIKSL